MKGIIYDNKKIYLFFGINFFLFVKQEGKTTYQIMNS